MSSDGLRLPKDVYPSEERIQRMERATECVREVLSPGEPDIAFSVLGPGWSSDLDVYVRDLEHAMRLAAFAGWVPLRGIMRHLGFDDPGSFAVVVEGEVLCRVDLRTGPSPLPLQRVVDRARRRGPDERMVLELRRLVEDGVDLSDLDPNILAAAADLEHHNGGSLLAPWRLEPSQTQRRMRPGTVSRKLIRRPAPRIAISGIDGSGKSTLINSGAEALARCGVETSVVWTRPGMRLKILDRLARLVRRLRGDRHIGLVRLAEGQPTDEIPSRRGVVGWIWVSLVSCAFILDVRKQTRRSHGVVLYDRHLLDALGTLVVLYKGVNSSIQRQLIRWLLPRADLSIWLDIEPQTALSRKPEDLIGQQLLIEQDLAYREYADEVDRLRCWTMDDEDPIDGSRLLRELADALNARRPPVRARVISWLRRRRDR